MEGLQIAYRSLKGLARITNLRSNADFSRRVSLPDCLSCCYAGDPVADDHVHHSLHLLKRVFLYTTDWANPIIGECLKGYVIILSRIVHASAH